MQESKQLKGLGGWLVVVGLGLFIALARLSYALITVYYPIFADGSFSTITSSGTTMDNTLWGAILISETLMNAVFIAAFGYLVYLFFSEHYLFPRVYIVTLIASAIYIPLDARVCSFVLVDEPIFDYSTAKETLRGLVSTSIWVPYILVSKRVKATFVQHRPVERLAPSAFDALSACPMSGRRNDQVF